MNIHDIERIDFAATIAENKKLKTQLEAMAKALDGLVGWIKDDRYKAPEQPIEIIVAYSAMRDAKDALSAYRNIKEQ